MRAVIRKSTLLKRRKKMGRGAWHRGNTSGDILKWPLELGIRVKTITLSEVEGFYLSLWTTGFCSTCKKA